jgi:hypothetical protein
MFGQELRQIRESRCGENRQVASIDNPSAQLAGLRDQPAEVGIHFRGAASDVERFDVGPGEDTQADCGRLAGHALTAVRSGIDVAMPTRLVANFADVNLQNTNADCLQPSQALFRERGIEMRNRFLTLPLQNHDLLAGVCERVSLSEQSQQFELPVRVPAFASIGH